MASKDDAPHAMSRRNFLKTSTLAGVGLGLGTAGLLGSAQAQAHDHHRLPGMGVRAASGRSQRQAVHGGKPGYQGELHTTRSAALPGEDGCALQCGHAGRCVLREGHPSRRLGRSGVGAADRRLAQARRAQQGHLSGDAADAVLQGKAIRRAVLRRHLSLPLRQDGAREGRREEASGHAGRAQERGAGSQEGGHHPSTRFSRATRPTPTDSTRCGRWSSRPADTCSTPRWTRSSRTRTRRR